MGLEEKLESIKVIKYWAFFPVFGAVGVINETKDLTFALA